MGFGIKLPRINLPKTPNISNIINPVNAISGISNAASGAVSGNKEALPYLAAGPLGLQALGIKNFVGSAPSAPSAGEDPNVTALRGRLLGEAQSFEKDLPGMQKQASDQIQREGDQALGQGLKGTKQNFNRRGLLYSGLREGAEQGVRGRVASEMANQKAQSNSDLNKMAAAKYQTAANVGLQGYQNAVNREAEIADIKMQNQVARAQVMQQLGQVGGQFAGSYYGSRGTQAANPTADWNPSSSGYFSGNYQPTYSSDQYRNDWNLNSGSYRP